MCGILGQINLKKKIDIQLFKRMRDTMYHRGPDDCGVNLFENDTVALGHRRLSFIDLTETGRQPMSNKNQTLWIVFNGEIYNYLELKQELSKYNHVFKTNSDTEVLLYGYETWGIQILNKIKGMFAFSILDLSKQELFMARDAFGVKPLYYYQAPGEFIFASEIKAILNYEGANKEIDFSSFTDYFVYQCVPSPKSIWKNINKLPAAHCLTLNIKTQSLEIREYKIFNFDDKHVDEREIIQEVGDRLRHSVSIHSRADVPVGSFLSGGYDSSAIVYYMKTLGLTPETFAVGLKGWNETETHFAKKVAKHLSVPLYSTTVTFNIEKAINMVADVFDEPMAYTSTFPTWKICKTAATKVKAIMSGDGGDEILAGYRTCKKLYESFGENIFDSTFHKKNVSKIDLIGFYSQILSLGNFDKAELKLLLHDDYQQYINDDPEWFYRKNFRPELPVLKSLQYLDTKCFMPELALTKLDQVSMAHSLEARVPFLDVDLFDRIFSLHGSIYYKHDYTKFLLYKNLQSHLPITILNRKKQGFVWPGSFYNNLKFYESALADSFLINHGIIRRKAIDTYISNNQYWKLWKVVVMEYWCRKWVT